MNKYESLKSLNSLKIFKFEGGQRVKNKYDINKEQILSIITVVKNSESTIEKTIQSVLSQKIENLEYIIIDGNSSDNTLGIIKKYEDKIDYWCCIEDEGIYDAMNYGLKLSSGKIIGLINSGDIYTNNSLKTVLKYFKKKEGISFLFGTVNRHYLGGNVIKKVGFNRKRIKYNFDSVTCHSTGFFIKNNIQKELGLYNTKYKCSSDYDLFYKLLIQNNYNGSSTTKEEIIGIVESGGFSSKYGYWKKLKEEMSIRIENNQSYFLILIIFFNSIIKHFFKLIKKKFIFFR